MKNKKDYKYNKNKSSSKKTPKWFYAVIIAIPIVLLLGLEIILCTVDYGYNFDTWVDAGNGTYVINPNIGRKYFTTGNFNPNTIEDVFDQQKKENSFRVFVLGGSSAEGYPFNPMGSFSRYIRKRLELVYSNTKVEVVNISMTAVNSYTILDLIPDVLEMQPDLVLIYAGHNEYYGAMGVGSSQSFGSIRAVNQLILFLNNFKITQLVRNTLSKIVSLFIGESKDFSGTLMSRMAQDKQIKLNSATFNLGLEQFSKNLTAIVEKIKDKEVPLVLGKLVANLKDQRPFISVRSDEYKSADEVYKEAIKEYKEGNYKIADSLFKRAKDLDCLRFRAPEKMNQIIDNIGKQYKIPITPIDSIFASQSENGIVGDNLIVDHLHPNVEGYLLMGKGFYESMSRNNYLPQDSIAAQYKIQDSLTRVNFVFTKLDSVLGNYYVKILKSDWPYKKEKVAISEFQPEDFYNLFKPKNFIDSLAMIRIQNKVNWVEAHLIGATYNLRKDNIKEYLKYMEVLLYQYPYLQNLDYALRYFQQQNKIKWADYTPKRSGLMALYLGNYDNAIKLLTDAYKLDEKNPLILYSLSLAYFEKGEYESADKFIKKCLAVDKKYPDANSLSKRISSKIILSD